MASTPGFESGPHWWEASALTTATPLLLKEPSPPDVARPNRQATKRALKNTTTTKAKEIKAENKTVKLEE